MPVGIVAGLVVIAVGVLVVLFITREDPGARSIDEAVEEFRSDTDGGGTSPGDGAAAGGPPAGVYLLEGSGTESLSFPPLSQSDGETMPMTVGATDGGCWTVRIDYNEAHWQDWNLCRDGDSVIESGDLKVLVDPNSAPHLTGSKVDFIADHRGAGFTVDNPNSPDANACSSGGCSGCVETGAFGKEAYVLTGYFNLVKVLEITLHNGIEPQTGAQLGPTTGDFDGFASFDDFLNAFKAHGAA